jgi:sugar O-acyltransferase (sialic acid O-acetyltransferase NeuD family)
MIRAVFGTGGFGREVMPILARKNQDSVADWVTPVFVEDAPKQEMVNGFLTMSTASFQAYQDGPRYVAIAVGNPEGRFDLVKRMDTWAGPTIPLDVVSPLATLYPPYRMDAGHIVCAYVSIHPNARIGRFFHANIYSYVAHDCVIEDFVTFSPRVNCNGNVHVGEGAYIGTAAVMRHGSKDHPLRIGKWSIVGMGAVVTKDVPDGAIVAGNPAKVLKWRPGYEPKGTQ